MLRRTGNGRAKGIVLNAIGVRRGVAAGAETDGGDDGAELRAWFAARCLKDLPLAPSDSGTFGAGEHHAIYL